VFLSSEGKGDGFQKGKKGGNAQERKNVDERSPERGVEFTIKRPSLGERVSLKKSAYSEQGGEPGTRRKSLRWENKETPLEGEKRAGGGVAGKEKGGR